MTIIYDIGQMLKKVFTAIVLLASFSIGNLVAAGTVFIFDSYFTEGYYVSSEQGEGKFGHNLMVSPSVFRELNEKNTLFSNYTMTYEETNQVIEEDGVRWTDRIMGNTLIVGWIHSPRGERGRFRNKLSAFGSYEFSQGTRDEDLLTGLYNYTDIGLKNEISILTELKGKPAVATAGYKYYYRRFPNYEGLYYMIYEKGPRWEKDYIGNRVWAGLETSVSDKVRLSGRATYLFKYYTDDLVQQEPSIESDYPYTSDRRLENVVNLDLGCDWEVLDWLDVGFGLSPEWRRGNQNYYDSDRLTFIPRVYDYDRLGASFDFLFAPWRKVSFRAGYEIIYRQYTDNLAFDGVGDYTDEKLNKLDHVIKVGASYPLHRNLNIALSGYHNISTSNTRYERIYGYNYSSSNISIGVDYKF